MALSEQLAGHLLVGAVLDVNLADPVAVGAQHVCAVRTREVHRILRVEVQAEIRPVHQFHQLQILLHGHGVFAADDDVLLLRQLARLPKEVRSQHQFVVIFDGIVPEIWHLHDRNLHRRRRLHRRFENEAPLPGALLVFRRHDVALIEGVDRQSGEADAVLLLFVQIVLSHMPVRQRQVVAEFAQVELHTVQPGFRRHAADRRTGHRHAPLGDSELQFFHFACSFPFWCAGRIHLYNTRIAHRQARVCIHIQIVPFSARSAHPLALPFFTSYGSFSSLYGTGGAGDLPLLRSGT